MALLNRWTTLGKRARFASLTALLGLAGCAIIGSLQSDVKPFSFSHKLHIEDQGLGCTDCHLKSDTDERPTIPNAKQCALCHNDIDAQKPPEKQIAQLFEGNEFKAHDYSRQSEEIVFPHLKHATLDLECTACHAAVATSEMVTPELKIGMDTCVACHQQKNAPTECSTCHSKIREDVPPPNHGATWQREHGRVMRANSNDVRAERCDTCHSESSCTACHKSEPPQSHNGFWRRRGHGLSASMDRKSCSACHEPESCEACHSATKPINHAGSWGDPLDRHCLTCHEPLRFEENCQTCHKDTPSHALAAPMPDGHIPGMNCRQCHGNGQPLPHVDNGSNCLECHH
ncbi:MAG: cytochrome c3 family protein [Planctomycetes bacterium]|nr:cytochrome c3 family protein [Planctomycetota bacterium]